MPTGPGGGRSLASHPRLTKGRAHISDQAPIEDQALVARFRAARKDPVLAVLEGLHSIKHALRFGAGIQLMATRDMPRLLHLCSRLAPDVEESIRRLAKPVSQEVFARLSPVPPETGVIAIARRRLVSGEELLAQARSSPLVLLEDPSHMGNVGAVIRVAAAVGAAGVLTTGEQDPWNPAAIRGAAGLQYAVPVARIENVASLRERVQGPLIAIHPEGEQLRPGLVPSDAVLAFGSERQGLSDELLEQADRQVSIPMKAGVSSLNLATAAAVVLYGWRLFSPGVP